ncbi:MAG: 3-isopropylmalate dehydratase large subunit [Synergistaceae bacterium]|jgi:homoaconitase/3-isopropylmalate dehydratase large subunit|nr:3-isopropylmalate dehydratase large subunit [Synergistaceae bacterium]
MTVTETEKILARGCGREKVRPGEIVEVEVDRAMIHDNNAALVIGNFGKIVDASVRDPKRVAFFIDHHSPSTSTKAVKHQSLMRRFAKEHGIGLFYDCGQGISHIVMLEEALAGRGKIVVGTDSHTTGEGADGAFATGIGATEMAAVLATGRIWLRTPETVRVELAGHLSQNADVRDLMTQVLGRFGPEGANYCAVEFHGAGAEAMSREERVVCCVLSMEMGAKNALFASGEDTAECSRTERFDLRTVEPTIAIPSLPTNARPLSEVASQKIRIDQAFAGSCTGGLLRDLKKASEVVQGKKVAEGVRFLVIPASRKIYNEALALGYLKILHDAGAVIGSPACGACGGHDAGILAEKEVCIANSPRNMEGRMGAGGVVYLGSTATVAASAVAGHVTGAERD